jgi:hypothetical protein
MGFRARESVVERTWHSVNTQLIAHYEDLIKSKVQEGEVKVA